MESQLFFVLSLVFVLSLLFIFLLLRYMSLRRGFVRGLLMLIFGVMVLTLACWGAAYALDLIKGLRYKELNEISAAYDNSWIKVLHIVAISAAFTCFAILAFFKPKRKLGNASNKKAIIVKNNEPKSKPQSAQAKAVHKPIPIEKQSQSRYSSYFSQFDPSLGEAERESVQVRDVFKEFGNSEQDVRAAVDRMANKINLTIKNKNSCTEISINISGTDNE